MAIVNNCSFYTAERKIKCFFVEFWFCNFNSVFASLIAKLNKPKLQELLEDEEFQKENTLNVERLYALLGKIEEDTLKEVL